MEKASRKRNAKLAIAGPKDYTHTELVTVASVLWSICFEKESYIMLVSASSEQAQDILAQVKDELETNPILKKDFPNVTGKNTRHWRRNIITTRNGIRIKTAGLNQKFSFRRYQNKLPSLVIFDLIQDHPTDFNAEKRFNTDFNRFEHLTDTPTEPSMNLIAVGTMTHPNSVLAKICYTPCTNDFFLKKRWETHIYKAILSEAENQELWDQWWCIYHCNEVYKDGYGDDIARQFFEDHKEQMLRSAKVLWPEREDYYTLKVLEAEIGKDQFKYQKQNIACNTPFGNIPLEEIQAAMEQIEEELANEEIDEKEA